jgi:hypothetical protein
MSVGRMRFWQTWIQSNANRLLRYPSTPVVRLLNLYFRRVYARGDKLQTGDVKQGKVQAGDFRMTDFCYHIVGR